MDVSYIKEFIVLADTGNYLEAADKLFITQSSLTRHIQKMEADLGFNLFDRTTRKVVLSTYGKLFLPYAKEIQNIIDNCDAAFRDVKLREENTIRIGSIPSMAQYKITNLIAEFQKEQPSIFLDITESDTLQSYELLYKHELDFAITRQYTGNKSNEDFVQLPITEDTMVALMPKDHPFAHESSIELRQLYRNPLILLGKDTFMYSLCVKECRLAGFEPNIAFTSHQIYNIVDLISRGMGVGLVTKQPVLATDHSNIAIVDVKPTIRTAINLTYLKSRKLTKSQKVLVDFFSSHRPS